MIFSRRFAVNGLGHLVCTSGADVVPYPLCARGFSRLRTCLYGVCAVVAKVKIEVSNKLDVLGPWDEPIKKAVREAMPGAKPSYTMLPMGRAALVVLWQGFKGHDVTDRQEQVYDTVAKLGDDALKRITMIVALTPEEARGLGEPSP
jgi:hypothetical protein